MRSYTELIAAAMVMLILAGCGGNNGGTAVEMSSSTGSTEREVSTEVTTEVQTEADATAPEITTAEPVTEAPETAAETTVAATTPPEPGATANGYTITVVDGITYVDGTLIANKTYALPETYDPGGLTAETYAAFMEMQSAASAEGLYIFVKSGYRSYYDQRYIYNGYVDRDGQAAADRYSARAGHSEHQSGMAIDVNSTSWDFANTPEGIWLKNNCHLYGFIIRYPEGKEHVTGYMYEPWHIRYVGKELAAAVTDSGLTLEEYFGITSVYG